MEQGPGYRKPDDFPADSFHHGKCLSKVVHACSLLLVHPAPHPLCSPRCPWSLFTPPSVYVVCMSHDVVCTHFNALCSSSDSYFLQQHKNRPKLLAGNAFFSSIFKSPFVKVQTWIDSADIFGSETETLSLSFPSNPTVRVSGWYEVMV